jgi:anti-anti-sigma factor
MLPAAQQSRGGRRVQEGGHPGIVVTHDPPGVAVVSLAGEHDQYTAPKLSATLADLLAEGSRIVVDLRRAEFLDSTTAGALLVADQRATAGGSRLVVVLTDDSPGPVRRLFETARLGTILTVAPSFEFGLELARPSLQSEE